MINATHTNGAVLVKLEPRTDFASEPQPQLSWVSDYYSDAFQAPFVDLVRDAAMATSSSESPIWSPTRPDASPMDEDVADAFILHSLLSNEELEQTQARVMTSPVATSDVARVHAQQATSKPAQVPLATALKQLCSSHGCTQFAADGDRCKRHSGGRRCSYPDCTKNCQSNGRCIRHGGGRRCEVEGCPRGAQARGKCKAHGGGVRCKAPGCTRSSQGSRLCRTHGGGKLCDYPGCKKGTQRRGKCSTHGGARRCSVQGCGKVDRGGGLCARHKAEAAATDGSDFYSD